jgi:hypothetical protein
MTISKEVTISPMDLVPNDPIEILKGLPSAEFPRDYSLKFADLLTKNPKLCEGREIELAHCATNAFNKLDERMFDPNQRSIYLSMNDLAEGLAPIKKLEIQEILSKRIKKLEEIKDDSEKTQMSGKITRLLTDIRVETIYPETIRHLENIWGLDPSKANDLAIIRKKRVKELAMPQQKIKAS